MDKKAVIDEFYKKLAKQVNFKKATDEKNLVRISEGDVGHRGGQFTLYVDRSSGDLIKKLMLNDVEQYGDNYGQPGYDTIVYEEGGTFNEGEHQELVSRAEPQRDNPDILLGPNEEYILRKVEDGNVVYVYYSSDGSSLTRGDEEEDGRYDYQDAYER